MRRRTGPGFLAICFGSFVSLLFFPGSSLAVENEAQTTIRAAIEDAMAPRLATVNDAKVEVSVGTIDPRLQLAACPDIDVSLPPSVSATMTAKVSCEAPRWVLYVPVHVHAWADAIVAAANLIPNRALSARDLTRGRVDMFAATGGVLTDEKDVEGKILRAGLQVGAPILSAMLDLPISIHRGQRVVLTATDATMVIKTTAVALEDGRVGDNIAVQNPDSQKTVRATVTDDGGVAIKF
jgi:flagella basal body P-ring formation protein FlgA